MKHEIFHFYPATNKAIGVLSIPHSGEDIPAEFRPYLSGNRSAYNEDLDFKVNELVDIPKIQAAGINVIVAKIHRVTVDLNRSRENALFFWKENTKKQKIILKEPDPQIANVLLDKYYSPYFTMLESMILKLRNAHPKLPFVDLHSMPSQATDYHMKQNPNQDRERPDFCLSNRNGKSSSDGFIQCFKNGFDKLGYDVKINQPYIGGYITGWVMNYGINNIQIEIKRSLYMNERDKILNIDSVKPLKEDLTNILITGFLNQDV